jgi:hypothetical protein
MGRKSWLICLATLAAWLYAAAARAEVSPPEPSDAAIGQLVRQLGADTFRQRERAMRRLREIGVPAKAALLQGLRDADAEIRDRCRRVLVDVLEEDFQQRVDAFEADSAGQQQHHLPGWDRFRTLAGQSPEARELFVEMQRSESKLLESLAADPKSAGALLGFRCEDLQQRANQSLEQPGQLTLGSLAAMFFVASDPQLMVNDRVAGYLHSFSYQPAMQLGLRGGRKTEPLKRVVGSWVARTAGSSNAYPGLMLSMQYDLREGLEPALNLVRQPGSQAQFLQMALLVVGRFGDREHIAVIEPLLENRDGLFTQNQNGQAMKSEVRDVALAVLVHLSGQDLKEYGFDRIQRDPRTLFSISTIGYASESSRDKAIQKWKAWSAIHKADR